MGCLATTLASMLVQALLILGKNREVYERITNLKYLETSEVTLMTSPASNTGKCGQLCFQEAACSYFRFQEGTCSLYETMPPTPGIAYFRKIGERCSVDSDCIRSNPICSSGICDCDLGFSYNMTSTQCVDKCDDYGTQFSMQSSTHCLSGYNNDLQVYTSVNDCALRCAQETGFTCRTFEIWNGYCWFSASTKSDHLDAWNPWTGCMYFQRHCALSS